MPWYKNIKLALLEEGFYERSQPQQMEQKLEDINKRYRNLSAFYKRKDISINDKRVIFKALTDLRNDVSQLERFIKNTHGDQNNNV